MTAARRGAVALALAIGYVVLPVPGWGLLAGRPLGVVGTLALLALVWTWRVERRVPLARAWPVLLAAKLALGLPLLVPHGFVATYHADDAWQSAPARSIDFLTLGTTRVDEALRFRPQREPFPLYFFNDATFNVFGPGAPERTRLPFSVVWVGWLRAEDVSPRGVYLAAPPPGFRELPLRWRERYTADYFVWLQDYAPTGDADNARAQARYTAETGRSPHRPAPPPEERRERHATLRIDDRIVVTLAPGMPSAETAVRLAPGWHRVDVRYASPAGAPREFFAGILDGRRHRSFDATMIWSAPVAAWRRLADRVMRAASRLADVVVLAALALAVARGAATAGARLATRGLVGAGRPGAGGAALALLALAVTAWAAWRGRALIAAPLILSGGDDWFTHETLAREIALHGPLMLFGHPPGAAEAFSTQPFYPYFLAVVHLLIGEDFWGVWLVQWLLFAGTVWAMARVSRLMFGRVEAWLTAALTTYFLLVSNLNNPAPALTGFLLTESLFLPLLAFWVLALLTISRDGVPSAARIIGVGLLGGLAVVTRSPLLLAVPVVAALVARAWSARWGRPARRALALFLVALALPIALATARNVIAAHQAVLISSAGPTNLYAGNTPPPDVDVSAAATRPIYRRLGLDPRTAAVVEYAIQAPQRFAQGLTARLVYVVGVAERGAEPTFFALTWLGALVGVIAMVRTRGGSALVWLPAVVAAAHLVVIVIVGNFAYGYRLAYPVYLVLVPYAARGVTWLLRTP